MGLDMVAIIMKAVLYITMLLSYGVLYIILYNI